MTFIPTNISLHAINTEIQKVYDATKEAAAKGADKRRVAVLLNGLEKLQSDVKALCRADGGDDCTFTCPWSPPTP